MNEIRILQLQTFPAAKIGLAEFRKEVIKVGHYQHPGTKQEFDVTVDTLNHWAATFARYIAGGNKVPIPLGHARDGKPEANAGWVTSMAVEDDSLICKMTLSDPTLSLTTDVSLCIENERTDSKGVVYKNVITHIALCTDPVIVGLGKFTKLSLSIGDKDMDFIKKLAQKLGVVGDEPTEDAVLLALDAQNKVKPKKESPVTDPLVKMVSENRSMKLSNLVKAGVITPAVLAKIKERYTDMAPLTLSMASEVDDGFDLLHEVLLLNRPAKLGELTGVQSLELANQAAKSVDPDMDRRREEAKNMPGYVVPA